MFNLWLRDFGFHRWRRNAERRLGELERCSYHELVALDFRERPGFSSGGQITRSLPLDSEPLNGPARVFVNDVVIRAVIIDHIVLNVDVGHVHRIRDVGNVLRWWKDAVPQNRFTDKTNVAKVVILRADIVFDVHTGTDGLSFIDDVRTARGQGRPANVIATGSPRHPSRSPIQIATRNPDPAVVRQIRPATIMIGRPTEIFVTDPGPSVICVRPISVRIRTPVRIAYGYVRLPAISIAFNIDPVPAGKIIVKEVDRYVVSSRLRKSTHNKSQHA